MERFCVERCSINSRSVASVSAFAVREPDVQAALGITTLQALQELLDETRGLDLYADAIHTADSRKLPHPPTPNTSVFPERDDPPLVATVAFAVVFATAVVWGASLIDVVRFTPLNVASATVLFAAAVVLSRG